MSFSFQRSEVKKDEEGVPAREGDPLLPPLAPGPRARAHQYHEGPLSSSSNFFENNNSSSTLNNSGGLRARRSPTFHTTSSPNTTARSTSNNFIQNPTTEEIDSQMVYSGDEIQTKSTEKLNVTDAALSNNHLKDNDDASSHYIDLTTVGAQHQPQQQNNDSESQAGNAQSPRKTSTPRFEREDGNYRFERPPDRSAPQEPGQYDKASQYETASSRPPSPDGGRSLGDTNSSQPQPLLEIPEEIYAVRKAALKVLKPLTKTWIVISVGFSLTVLFGMARWTRLLPTAPYWFILFPCWASHFGLLWLHILSARALSGFISEANNSRQRPDSRDHLNRTEYLPLLQRSLKFGLKTGILSFFVFVFEILIFIRLTKNTISMTAAFVPLWMLVAGGIVDGLVCKTQHFLRVLCWTLLFVSMLLMVLKLDYGFSDIRWRIVVFPVVTVLSMVSGSLIYIIYGHQIGYYKLTEAQLTAGNLYALAALIYIILVVLIGEVIPSSRPIEIETRVFVVTMAPLAVCLTGMGAWVVSRDEFSRLLLYGGQAAVHPKKLRWIPESGWTCVQGKGVTVVPMFGEVSFQPLERGASITSAMEMCRCCTTRGCCYPYEDEEDEENALSAHTGDFDYQHPYLEGSPSQSGNRSSYSTLRGL